MSNAESEISSTAQKTLSAGGKSLNAEICNLGHIIRHLQPPGGKESGIFDTRSTLPPAPAPKKVNNYLKSRIFDTGKSSPPKSRPGTPAPASTFNRLFPVSPPMPSTVRHNHLKSTVFEPDPPRQPPVSFVQSNPITGTSSKSADDVEIPERQIRNPITFEGVPESAVPSLRCTQPPGGKSTFVLEYIE